VGLGWCCMGQIKLDMKKIFLATMFLISGKCFSQDTLELPKQHYEKRANGNSAFVINPVKLVTGNYTLTENDNGVTIHISSGNITIPVFDNSFVCWILRIGTTRPIFTGGIIRSGFTPLSSRYQSVTVSALPKQTAIIY